jgi:O-antigen/teichoic acid export membrane protein
VAGGLFARLEFRNVQRTSAQAMTLEPSSETVAERGLFEQAKHGIIWSVVQNWGGKLLAFGLSILLARLLNPTDFGIASAASLVLLLIPLIAEFGFSDAILQRQGLKWTDINLPFYVSVAAATVMVAGVMIFSDSIAAQLGVEGLGLYIVAIAATVLINAPSAFQEAMYKRHLKFRTLAIRTFLTNILGGGVAVLFAWYGFGIWSFVVSAYVGSLLNLVWLWWTPEWKPGVELDIPAFRQMVRFGAPVVVQRLVDFGANKFIDVLIIGNLGMAAYGLYTVGSRLYLTMMQLLQGAFYDVSLAVLSTASSDRERMARTYLKTIGMAATFLSPIFVVVAAVSPEVAHVLLGDRWKGVEDVMTPLLLLGALQCVQFINGPFISARGRPELTLIAGLVKSASAILALILIPSHDVKSMTIVFALSLLAATPVTYYFVIRELGLSVFSVMKILFWSLCNGAICFFAVRFARPYVQQYDLPSFWQGLVLGFIFGACSLLIISITDFEKIKILGSFIHRKGTKSRNHT